MITNKMARVIILLISFHFFVVSLPYAQEPSSNKIDCITEIDSANLYLLEENSIKLRASLNNLSESRSDLSETCLIDFFLLKGKHNLNDGKLKYAELFFLDALEKCTNSKFPNRYVEASYYLALAKMDESKNDAAEILDGILKDKKVLLRSGLAFEALEIRSILHSSKGEHEKAMHCLKESMKYIGSKAEEQELKTQILNQIATNYQTLGQVDSSIFYYKNLINLKTKVKDSQGLLSDYSTLGGLYKEIGSYEDAQKSFMKAIQIGEEIEDSLSLLTTYIDIAKVYLEQRLIDPALEYTEKAEALSKINNALFIEGQSYQMKAHILEIANQKDRALIYYDKALKIFEQLGLKQEVADTYLATAKLFGNEDNLEKAELALRKSLDIRLQSRDKTGELNIKLALCDVLLRLNKDNTEIRKWLDDCMILATESNNKSAFQEIYAYQSILDEQYGKYESALSNFQKHIYVRDSISNQKVAKTVRELEKKYQTAEKNEEIALQQKQIAEQTSALKKRNTQIVQLLSGLLVLLILSFLTFITYQRNKVFNEQKLSVIEKEKETQILRAMLSGEEQERRRIARDLHDGLGATMATVKMRINALRNNIPGIKEIESYSKAEELIDDACENIREISHNMMPGSLSRYGLEVALKDMCEAIEASNKIEVAFIPFGLDKIVDEVIEINIYRIIQELLKNIIKHAEAKEVIVQLTLEDDLLIMTVEDDGKGFVTKNKNIFEGIGLTSIRSRVIYLNGTIDIESNLKEGTSFNIEIPMKQSKKQKLWSKS